MTTERLRKAIVDLAAIDNEGLLAELQEAFAAECRLKGGGTPPADRTKQVATMQAGAECKARDIARVASNLLGMPEAKCYALARETFLVDPWTELALKLIAEYRAPSRLTTAEEKRQWNPVTGGPVIEQWEHEQRQLALAKANAGKQQRRKW